MSINLPINNSTIKKPVNYSIPRSQIHQAINDVQDFDTISPKKSTSHLLVGGIGQIQSITEDDDLKSLAKSMLFEKPIIFEKAFGSSRSKTPPPTQRHNEKSTESLDRQRHLNR